MTKRDKLLKRFCTLPKDFTFDEVESLFNGFGFVLENKGSTSGSRVIFVNKEKDLSFIMHKPHPSNVIKSYMIRQIMVYLKSHNLIMD